jgi:Uma2 family endonuclease
MATVETTNRPASRVLHGVSWDAYVEMSDLPENEHARMTYDRGDLEIMTVSRQHERYARFIEALIYIWTEERGIAIDSCGSMTIRREDRLRGFEPDNCYYIAHEPDVRGKDELDFSVDPPPDLIIEIEISRKAIGKMPIYAAVGVPEVWRYDGQNLHVHVLDDAGKYRRATESNCLPRFPIAEVERLLGRLKEEERLELVKSFRASVRAVPEGEG